jgi:hypothetical protein
MATTDEPTTSPPTPGADATVGVVPAAHRAEHGRPGPPSRHPGAAGGHDGYGDHAFWERLPFTGTAWTRVLFVGLVCFGLWFLLDAPSLHQAAQESPLGTRRTVSLDVTGPVASLSRTLGLSSVVGAADRVMGRTPGGGPALAVPTRKPPPKPLPTTRNGVPPPPVLPPLDYHPTSATPLKVLIVGDSVGLDLGPPLQQALASYGDVTTFLDGRIDTGLTRPDYFNWPAELHVDLVNDQPNLVVVMIGANDPQGLVTPTGSISYGEPGWDAAYSARVASFIAEANSMGAHVLWVGMPPMQNPGLNTELEHLNSLVEAQVNASKGGAAYLSSVPSLSTPQGGYTAYLPNAGGAEINIRTPDGIHLSPGGGTRLAAAVAEAIQTQLHVQLVQGTGGAGRR